MAIKKFETVDGLSSTGSVDVANTLSVSGNVTVNANALVVDSANKRIGVGKAPTVAVDVAGTVNATNFTGDGSTLSNIDANDAQTLQGSAPDDFLRANANDTIQDARVIVSNANIVVSDGFIRFNTNNELRFGTAEDVKVSGNTSGINFLGSNVAFSTNRLFVDTTNGRVGINRTNPSTALHVTGVVTATGGSSTNWNTAHGWGDHAAAGYIVDGGASTSKTSFNAGIRLNDSDALELGSSADSELFHNGSDLYLDLNLGNLILRDNNTTRGTFERTKGRMTANAFAPGLKVASPGVTTTFDLTAGTNYVVTLNQNTTFAFTTDATSYGMSGTLVVKQDATGGRTFTLPAAAKTPVGGAAINQITTPGTVSILGYFVVDASTILVNYIGDFQ